MFTTDQLVISSTVPGCAPLTALMLRSSFW
jgi:hypothetical protein